MNIINTMAINALSLRFGKVLISVTIDTGCKRMTAIKREACFHCMIKSHFTPSGGNVTAGTFLAQTTLMNIIIEVTGGADGRRLAIGLIRFVAILAGDRKVFAEQSKIGRPMIKFLGNQGNDVCIAPNVLCVTRSAFACLCFGISPVKTKS
jgi:hypothetical protein